MREADAKFPIAAKLAAGIICISVLLAALLAFQQLREPARPSASLVPPLRLTAQQMLLNWQSFPGRHVTIEFCTVRASAEGKFTCVILDGSREAGFVVLDETTIDPKSADWVKANCGPVRMSRTCTVRVSGVLQKATDGRPFLEQAVVHQS